MLEDNHLNLIDIYFKSGFMPVYCPCLFVSWERLCPPTCLVRKIIKRRYLAPGLYTSISLSYSSSQAPPPSAPKNISSSIPFLKVSDNFQEHFLQPIFFVNRLPIENIFFLIDYFSLTDFLTDFYIKLQKCMCLDMYVCVNDMYYDVTVSQFCVASLY